MGRGLAGARRDGKGESVGEDVPRAPLEFLVVSDVHISLLTLRRARRLEGVLRRVALAAPTALLVVVGDFADYGMPWEYALFNRAISRAGWKGRVLCAFGNHEHRLGPFRWSVNRFARFARRLAKQLLEASARGAAPHVSFGPMAGPAFDVMVEGATHLIFLGSDEAPARWDGARISAQQAAWLADLLDKDECTGRLSLVFNHEPLFNTVAGSLPGETSGQSVEGGEALRAVLDAHAGAFLFTGHSHFPLDVFVGGGMGPTFANTGAVGFDDAYCEDFAQGWLVRVGAGEVGLTGLNLLTGAPIAVRTRRGTRA